MRKSVFSLLVNGVQTLHVLFNTSGIEREEVLYKDEIKKFWGKDCQHEYGDLWPNLELRFETR